jgi:hypothetical protein
MSYKVYPIQVMNERERWVWRKDLPYQKQRILCYSSLITMDTMEI